MAASVFALAFNRSILRRLNGRGLPSFQKFGVQPQRLRRLFRHRHADAPSAPREVSASISKCLSHSLNRCVGHLIATLKAGHGFTRQIRARRQISSTKAKAGAGHFALGGCHSCHTV